MRRPSTSWKYEAGFLTVSHAGSTHELGYFDSRENARKAVRAFFSALKAAGGEQFAPL